MLLYIHLTLLSSALKLQLRVPSLTWNASKFLRSVRIERCC